MWNSLRLRSVLVVLGFVASACAEQTDGGTAGADAASDGEPVDAAPSDETVIVVGSAEAPTIQAGLDLVPPEGATVLVPAGTYVITTPLSVRSHTTLRGEGEPTLLVADPDLYEDGGTGLIVNNLDEAPSTDIQIRDLAVDGNKDEMSPATCDCQAPAGDPSSCRCNGIYLVGVTKTTLSGLTVQNTRGHGVHISNGSLDAGLPSHEILVEESSLADCGVDGAAPRGSNLATTSVRGLRIKSVTSRDSAKAGFKLGGRDIGVEGSSATGNGNGGVVTEPADLYGLTVTGGEFSENVNWTGSAAIGGRADGIRLVDARDVSLNGVAAAGNDGSGVTVLNGCVDISIFGGVFNNNGAAETTPTAVEGRCGVSIINNGGTGNRNVAVEVREVRAGDDRATDSKTQACGVLIGGESDLIEVRDSDLRDNRDESLTLSPTATNVTLSGNQL